MAKAQDNAHLIKARSLSTMTLTKKKVDFIPTERNKLRMESLNKENWVRNVNNILRFENVR